MNTRNADIEHRGNLGQVQLLDEMELHDQLQPLGKLRDGFGERRPIAPNNSAANMQKNRRVEIVCYRYPNP